MPTDVTIRPERPGDHAVIGDVITAAFTGRPYADGDEAELVERLRRANALSLSLVAELAGSVVGQVAFSPAAAADGAQGWYALSPVAVLPQHQRIGIGSDLIRTGMEGIARSGALGCILVGDPAYYVRFGFRRSPANAPPGQPADYFMVKLLGSTAQPSGPVGFHEAFDGA